MRVREFDKQVNLQLAGSVEDNRSIVHLDIFRKLAGEARCMLGIFSLLACRPGCLLLSHLLSYRARRRQVKS